MLQFTYAVLILVLPLLLSCSGENREKSTEENCSAATGTWRISTASCNGTAVTGLDTVLFQFNSETSLTLIQGTNQCSTNLNWTLSLGNFNPTMNLSSTGAFSCGVNGAAASTCTTTENSCDSTATATGLINNFTSCVVDGDVMTLERTVAATNSTDMSYCQNGEDEIVTLVPSDGTLPNGSITSPQAVLAITGSDPTDFGATAVGANNSAVLTITNTGGSMATAIAATGLAAPFTFLGGVYPGSGGTCTTTLASAANCTVVVYFSPTAGGTFTDTLNIAYNDGLQTQSIARNLTGLGVVHGAALLTISDSILYNYGNVTVGGNHTHTFTLTNSGSGTATAINENGIATPFVFVGGSYPGVGGTCATSLAAGATCSFTITFSPFSVGLHVDSININYNDGSTTQSVTRNVMGTGVP